MIRELREEVTEEERNHQVMKKKQTKRARLGVTELKDSRRYRLMRGMIRIQISISLTGTLLYNIRG